MLKQASSSDGNILIIFPIIFFALLGALFLFNKFYLPKTLNIFSNVLGEKSQAKLPQPTNTPIPRLLSQTQQKALPKKTNQPKPKATPIPTLNKIYLGFWTEGLWDDPSLTLHPEKLIELQQKINKKSSIVHFFTGWGNLSSDKLTAELNKSSQNGWTPMISANPYFFEKCPYNNKTLYKTIADGDCDLFLTEASVNLKKYGKPVFLRYAWEMNIDSMEWSIQKTGSSTQDYINAWRRFYNIAKSNGATNILWVFCPNVTTTNSISINSLYPGGGYVDWLGLDGYNWGNTQSWSSWQSFSQIFSTSYNNLIKLDSSKPIMIGETNTTNLGGDKAAWYQQALSIDIPAKFPKIKALIFYNENRGVKENVNWLIDITPESLQAFSKYIQNPIYLSSF